MIKNGILIGPSAEEAIIVVAMAHVREQEELGSNECPFDFEAIQFEMGSRWLLNKPFISEEVLAISLVDYTIIHKQLTQCLLYGPLFMFAVS